MVSTTFAVADARPSNLLASGPTTIRPGDRMIENVRPLRTEAHYDWRSLR